MSRFTKFAYLPYVEWISEVGDCTRSEASEHFGVHLTTAVYNLESAVGEGKLEKFYTVTDSNQPGWCYRIPGTVLPLPFAEEDVYSDHQPDWNQA